MKKILAVILSAAMVLSMAACSSSSSNTQQSNDDSSTNTAEATGDLENFDIVLDFKHKRRNLSYSGRKSRCRLILSA